jgi:hypothetical protein
MGILDSIRGGSTTGSETDTDAEAESEITTEQLADGSDGEPRGESRDDGATGIIRTLMPGRRWRGPTQSQPEVTTDKSKPPLTIRRYWQDYFNNFPLTRAPLRIFDEAVAEPGYRVEATIERETGETDAGGDPITETVTDDDMQKALREWASQSAWHAHEADQDLSKLIRGNPSKRRGKGTLFLEIVRGESGMPTGLIYHPPGSIKIYSRENQAALVQPDDDVGEDHPRTSPTDDYPDGKAAAYVQYDETLSDYDDEDPVAFGADDIIKFVYENDTGDPWGTSVYASSAERIDALRQKLRDREGAIRLAGYPLRVYSSPQWDQEQATEWAQSHQDGEISSRGRERRERRLRYGPRNEGLWSDYSHGTPDEDIYDPADNPLANSNEFMGGDLDVKVVTGEVPDISGAVMDDIRIIFSDMPVARLKIGFEESINQFVAEPQIADDNRRVDQERDYLAQKFEPVFEEVADFLVEDDEYEGDVRFAIETRPSDNPLEREDFPRENLEALSGAVKEMNQAGADPALINGILSNAGVDVEEYRENYAEQFNPEDLAPELEDETPPEESLDDESPNGDDGDSEGDDE